MIHGHFKDGLRDAMPLLKDKLRELGVFRAVREDKTLETPQHSILVP